ncbi:hypothetical protein ACLOJK_033169 [Asimina triloba]
MAMLEIGIIESSFISFALRVFSGGIGLSDFEMERRSWLWRRKSSEKSPGETESSGSLSSLSERFSDEQDASRASPNHSQSLEVSSKFADVESKDNVKSPMVKATGDEVSENVKNLTEKLSAALLNISAKEDLVKQHARVAEEAVSGLTRAAVRPAQ